MGGGMGVVNDWLLNQLMDRLAKWMNKRMLLATTALTIQACMDFALIAGEQFAPSKWTRFGN